TADIWFFSMAMGVIMACFQHEQKGLSPMTKALLHTLEQNGMMSGSIGDGLDYMPPNENTIIPNNGSCYPPLIWYTGKIEDDMICDGSCCLSCPYMDNFYPENSIKEAFELFAGFGIVSFFAVLLLSMIFLVLPSQKKNPTVKQLLVPLALSVCYFEGSEFFTIQQENSQ
ncbi:20892_t:CDS:2, partial [Racocetra persica]